MSALLFLCQKSFHPARKQNQKKVWLAEERAQAALQREKERSALLQDEAKRNALKYGNDAAAASLDFMYAPPPGFLGEDNATDKNASEREEQRPEERFSFLKNAPVEGNAANVPVTNFKPLGIEIRNVRCLRCGQWGHSVGDKLCPMSHVKSEKDRHQQEQEDPLRAMAMAGQSGRIGNTGLSLRSGVLERGYGGTAGADGNPNQLLLDSDSDSEEDLEAQFLASLTRAQKRKLLRHFRREERKKQREERRTLGVRLKKEKANR